jgi:hypothetical protein
LTSGYIAKFNLEKLSPHSNRVTFLGKQFKNFSMLRGVDLDINLDYM